MIRVGAKRRSGFPALVAILRLDADVRGEHRNGRPRAAPRQEGHQDAGVWRPVASSGAISAGCPEPRLCFGRGWQVATLGARLADTGRGVTTPSVSRGLETSAALQIRVRRWPGANGGEPLRRCPGTRIFVNRLPSTMLRVWNSSAGGECPRTCLCFRWGLPDCLSWSGERVCLAFRAVAPDAEVGHDGNTPVSRENPEAVCASDGPRQVASRPEERTLLEPTETPRD